MTTRILSIIGGRPQYIKLAAISRALRQHPDVEDKTVDTGQHHDFEMSQVFLDELEIPSPAHVLGVHGGSHGEMVGRMLKALDPVLRMEDPDLAVVYGDTNSTLAGAIGAAKQGIPLAHVEAGLRSFRREMPEEINRILTDHCSQILFCPTRTAVRNLEREGIDEGIHFVGDVMYDIALRAAEAAAVRSKTLGELGLISRGYSVLTIHRSETTENPALLTKILDYVRSEAADAPIIMPLHPRTRKAVAHHEIDLGGIGVTEPLSYLDMTLLVRNAITIYTDSGGLQKEAYFHRVPCVTLRDETEWVETIEAGWNRLWKEPGYKGRQEIDDYGTGRSAELIARVLANSP